MASGDTKTEAMLNALGNGGSADEFRGCCNTKTQQYILDAIDRVQNVEDEVEELKNNPDVVDIVDTYADLQAYDTQHLSNNDIIRVLADETHSGNSTYYKFNKQAGTWTFIGEIAGGGGDIKTLSTDDYNYPTNNPDRVALWLLPNGLYRIPTSGVSVYYASNSIWTTGHGDFVIIEKYQAGAKPISMYFFGSTDGVEYCEVSTSGNLSRALAYTILSDRVSQSTGNSQYHVMSQNAVTSMVYDYAAASPMRPKIGNGASVGGLKSMAIGDGAYGSGNNAVALGGEASTVGHDGAVALGFGAHCTYAGEVNIGTNNTSYGYNASNYRLLTGLYDPQNDHDAATKGYVDANAGGPTVVQTTGTSNTDVMSQDATTKLIFADSGTQQKIRIGNQASSTKTGSITIGIGSSIANSGTSGVVIGKDAFSNKDESVAIGDKANASGGAYCVALGAESSCWYAGTVSVGSENSSNTHMYNGTQYRKIVNVYDGENPHDAVTVGQVNSVIDAINTALSTNIPHIGA